MSDIKDLLADVIKFAGSVLDEAQKNPVRVAITAEMFRSFVSFVKELNFDPATPEEEAALYKARDDFLANQIALAKQKLEG